MQFIDPRLAHMRSDQLLNDVYILPDWNLIPFLPFALGQFKQISFCVSLVVAAVCPHFPHGCCQITCRRAEFSGTSLYLPYNFSQGGLIIPVSRYPQTKTNSICHLETLGPMTFTKEILTATFTDDWL